MVHSRQYWIVNLLELRGFIIDHKRKLERPLINDCVLIHRGLINHLEQMWLLSPHEKLLFGLGQVVHHLLTEIMTRFESLWRVVAAHDDHPQILLLETRVNMQHVLLTAARHTDWCPCFPFLHRVHRPHIVQQKVNI